MSPGTTSRTFKQPVRRRMHQAIGIVGLVTGLALAGAPTASASQPAYGDWLTVTCNTATYWNYTASLPSPWNWTSKGTVLRGWHLHYRSSYNYWDYPKDGRVPVWRDRSLNGLGNGWVFRSCLQRGYH